MDDRKLLIFFPDRFIGGKYKVLTTYKGTERALQDGEDMVITTQMSFLDTRWLEDYDMSIITDDGKDVATYITVFSGHIIASPDTGRELKKSNNLFKLWKAGEFGG